MADIEVPHPGASDIVGRLLSDALSEHPDVQWLGLVSEDGFAIASEGEVSVDDDAVAAGAVRMMIPGPRHVQGARSVRCLADVPGGQRQRDLCHRQGPLGAGCRWSPGVPIGLLRYEAREIAEAFPMGQRPALTASPESTEDDEPESASQADWAVVNTGTFLADEFVEEQSADLSAADDFVTDPDGTPRSAGPTSRLFPRPVSVMTSSQRIRLPHSLHRTSRSRSNRRRTTSRTGPLRAWLTCPAIPCSTCRRPRPMFRCPSRCLEPVDDAVVSALDDLSDLAAPTGTRSTCRRPWVPLSNCRLPSRPTCNCPVRSRPSGSRTSWVWWAASRGNGRSPWTGSPRSQRVHRVARPAGGEHLR